ncbi:MAG: tripartite tricarboxylate transporter substrate binding protein [Betaproteobacteria bacterium]|nr:tripartite tricarboxylate transporter substrate binding protein [Betaproteobacteria bacterium]
MKLRYPMFSPVFLPWDMLNKGAAPSCISPTSEETRLTLIRKWTLDPCFPCFTRTFPSPTVLSVLACAVLVLLPAAAVQAQNFPSRPNRLVLPFSAGTGIDTVCRSLAQAMAQRLGQPVIVENRLGASGTIAYEAIARSTPDGHAVLMAANNLTMSPSLYKLRYDPAQDLAPVALVTRGAMVLATRATLELRNAAALIAAAKQNPGKLNYATPGVGTPQHLAMELLMRTSGANLSHIPYKGAAETVTGLISGQTDVSFVPLQSALPHIRSGRLHALGVSSPLRNSVLPEVPTVAEAIGSPGFEVDLWYGLFVAAQTPADVLRLLNREAREIVALADMQAVIAAQGMTATPSSPDDLRTLVVSDLARWARVIREANIRAE